MTDKTQPEALRLANEFKLCNEYDSIPSMNDIAKAEAELRRQHASIVELEADHFPGVTKMTARWYMVDKDGMATLCTDREDAEQEAKDANMAWPHTAPHRAVQLVEASFDSADMATASAQGFRDGVASLAASAGSEPVAWRAQFDAWWARNRVSTHHVKNIGGFAAKVWHAAIQTVVGATDSTAGFYPADEGSNPSRQATNSSPQEGMVGGWISVEDRLPEWAARDDTPCFINGKEVPPTLTSETVLVALKGGGIRTDKLTTIEGKSDGWWHTYGERVVAWQKTPAPPASEAKGE